MDAAYVSAFFGLAGAAIGGLTSFGTSWLTQQSQLRDRHRDAARTRRETLFNEFIAEATRLYGDALTHEKDDVTDLVGLYALVARMRLLASRPVIAAAEDVMDAVIATYLAPNRTLHEMQELMKSGSMNFLHHFSEACRTELAAIV